MEVNGQVKAPATLSPGYTTHWIEFWFVPGVCLDIIEKIQIPWAYRDSNPRSSSPHASPCIQWAIPAPYNSEQVIQKQKTIIPGHNINNSSLAIPFTRLNANSQYKIIRDVDREMECPVDGNQTAVLQNIRQELMIISN
jgi:hypothetical protein